MQCVEARSSNLCWCQCSLRCTSGPFPGCWSQHTSGEGCTLLHCVSTECFHLKKQVFYWNYELIIHYLRGIWLSSPSSRWTVTLGFALRASNTILMFFLVWSETPRLWPEERSARPSWKKLDSAPPMEGGQEQAPPVLWTFLKLEINHRWKRM